MGELTRIPLKDFSKNPTILVNRVAHEHISIVVEKDGEPLAVLKPVRPKSKRRGKKSAAARKAFLAAAGSWRDVVDTDKFLADNYESRRLSTRPHVEL
ncbi:MAG TPA: type II toxin-antitoxin system prevent-host-death family antitoxin [Anaerolineae bacterium]|nr:type II toxin-antitoxin system prevent-host-death family antitoxin [Anaerolineae bacterium]